MSTKKPSRSRSPKHKGGRWSVVVPERIRELQEEHGLTQQEFGARCGVEKSAVNNWLSGRNLLRMDELRGVCDAFGVTADWLLGVELAPKYRLEWPASESTFAEMLANAMLRDLPPEVAELEGNLAVFVEHVLDDARTAVHREARELAEAMGWVDQELMSDLTSVLKTLARLREWVSQSRRKDAGRLANGARDAALVLGDVRRNLRNERPRVFSATGTNELRYLRLSATGRRVWSERSTSEEERSSITPPPQPAAASTARSVD